jgi:hypothetical protein
MVSPRPAAREKIMRVLQDLSIHEGRSKPAPTSV